MILPASNRQYSSCLLIELFSVRKSYDVKKNQNIIIIDLKYEGINP